MGKGKLQKFREMESFNHVIQAPYKDVLNSDHFLKGKWAKEFFRNTNPIILELGCGKGEYSVKLAERFPGKNFIGVDIKGARIWKGAKQSFEHKLKNVGFIRTNIEIIDRFFGKGEISEIWLTFPDPQMKKANKRLTSINFISKYKKFLDENGMIHLKTDSNYQFLYTSALVEENNFEVVAKTNDLYNS
ncbi:MAG: tRNA (guanosine(46)-N7)-methyltransferase TrmB, partial [Prolixibacteraceae bacterium]|nr:tRNA (guanosine(46)-N7)-methyltransferase TrmB [Prolixibacteraceae bacterium]